MRLGIIISIIALVNLIALNIGFQINQDYFIGSFIGGVIVVFLEIIYEKGHYKYALVGEEE